MIPRAGLFLLLLLLPAQSYSQSDRDLRSRVVVDGSAAEYTGAEWVLDAATRFPEHPADSRWGLDNDLRGIAVTWDYYNLYIAADCSVAGAAVMLFIDCRCGGPAGLQNDAFFRRNISFRNFTPNVIVYARSPREKPEASAADCNNPPEMLHADAYGARLLLLEPGSGALEVAVPWELIGGFRMAEDGVAVPEEGYRLNLCAAVTGGDAAGAGDAVPDTAIPLAGDSTLCAVLDNYITIPLDADRDGMLDIGVEPRQAAMIALTSAAGTGTIPGIGVAVDTKLFAPAAGEVLEFRPFFEGEYAASVHITAEVYSASGKLVRVLFKDRATALGSGSPAAWDSWDGKDARGEDVPGGVYILAVRCEETPAGTRSVAKAAVAVVR